MVDFSGIKTFLFHLKMHQNRWWLGLRPDQNRWAYHVLQTVGEDENEGKNKVASNLNFFQDHATVVNLNRTKRFFFNLKWTKIAGGWGSAPRPRWRSLQRSPAVRRFRRGGKWEGRGRGGKRRRQGGEGRGKCVSLYEILNTPLLTEPPPQTPPPLDVGLRPRTQITSSFSTYAI